MFPYKQFDNPTHDFDKTLLTKFQIIDTYRKRIKTARSLINKYISLMVNPPFHSEDKL